MVELAIDKASQQYQHWRLAIDSEYVLWLTLDRQQASVNSLDAVVLTELDQILDQLDTNKIVGVVIGSAKQNGFIAGADISQFVDVDTYGDAYVLMSQAQQAFDKLARLPIPTVAMIHGFCLGGGMELALACRYRIAADIPATILGFPEVFLGLHPGWGGTVRLPQLIGPSKAMLMMLTGQNINAQQAKQYGVVDTVAPIEALTSRAKEYILKPPPPRQARPWQQLLQHRWLRPWVSCYYYHWLSRHINKTHNPATYVIIDNWRQDGARGEQAYSSEAASISHLMLTQTSRQLVRIFLLRSQLKALARGTTFKPKHIHIIGCGERGCTLAVQALRLGLTVSVQDIDEDVAKNMQQRVVRKLRALLPNVMLVKEVMKRITVDLAGDAIIEADAIVEAVAEDVAVKQQVFADIAQRKAAEALMVSTTKRIALSDIADSLVDKRQLLGISVLGLGEFSEIIEVMHLPETDVALQTQAAALVTRLGCLPVMVKAVPGNALLHILVPYVLEAMRLCDEGIAINVIDQSLQHFGMPIGPLMLADLIGLDNCANLAKQLPMLADMPLPEALEERLSKQHLGCCSGEGFYKHPHQKIKNPLFKHARSGEITRRLVPLLLNAAVAVHAAGIISDDNHLDASLVFASAFPAFRGGPIAYLKNYGTESMMLLLERLATQYGDHYQCGSDWQPFKQE